MEQIKFMILQYFFQIFQYRLLIQEMVNLFHNFRLLTPNKHLPMKQAQADSSQMKIHSCCYFIQILKRIIQNFQSMI